MRVIVDTHLKLDLRAPDITLRHIAEIKRSLMFENPERETARSEHVRGWQQMPEHVYMFRHEGDVLILPRGYASSLLEYAANESFNVHWIDNRVDVLADWSSAKPITLKPHQEPAVEMMLQVTQGIYRAPPGSGKTVSTLEALRRYGRKAIVIVDKTQLMRQWAKEAKKHLNIEVGMIGDDEYDVDEDFPLTIAMQQTLYSRRDELDNMGFFDKFGAVVEDEVHHVSATTYYEIIQRFPAAMRLGVSATPDMKNGYFQMTLRAIGPIFYETTRQELVSTGFILDPKVIIKSTDYEFPFHRTHWAESVKDLNEPCTVNGCDKEKRHLHRNNYATMIADLIRNDERNEMIARDIGELRGRKCLVTSNRLEHLNRVRDLIIKLTTWPEERVFMMTGEIDSVERMEITKKAEEDEIVILSTVMDEGTDIPSLTDWFNIMPSRNIAAFEQKKGRIERSYPGKKECVVHDYEDYRVGVFRSQVKERIRKLYMAQGLEIVRVDSSGVITS